MYQYPSRALLNPQKDASILREQEIWIEPVKPKIGMAGCVWGKASSAAFRIERDRILLLK